MNQMGQIADRLRVKLIAALEPSLLEIVDDSGRHAGHAGASMAGETHFDVAIVSKAFAGLGRLQRQRLVYAAVAEELAGPVHALSIKASAPGES
jgi:BolA protein